MTDRIQAEPADDLASGLSPLKLAELPPPPGSVWKIIGPGLVAAGVGLGSGEFIFFPYVASQIGLGFLWAAVLGIGLQFVLNLEFERYTLATGETALTGFNRLWRHWGLVFVSMAVIAFAWPGLASSAATLVTYLVGGDANGIAIALLVGIGVTLTFTPVVFRALERAMIFKVAAVFVVIAVSVLMVIPAETWVEAPVLMAQPVLPLEQFSWALLLGALAFAGMGGPGNLCQSNWIRDKGFGMGAYAPRIVSPLFGKPIASSGTGWRFEPDEELMRRWRGWWRLANLEQLATFVAISLITIIFLSILAFTVLYGRADLPSDISFLRVEAEVLSERVGAWFGRLFLAVGAVSLFATALGSIDVISRLTADVVHTSYRKGRSESSVYAVMVWGMVAFGVLCLVARFDQPLVLLVLTASLSGFMMFIFSGLLIILNRRLLAREIRPGVLRIGGLVASTLLFGVASFFVIREQVGRLFG